MWSYCILKVAKRTPAIESPGSFLAKTELRAKFQSSAVDDIDSKLLTRLFNNYDFIDLYKDRVEMAGALE